MVNVMSLHGTNDVTHEPVHEIWHFSNLRKVVYLPCMLSYFVKLNALVLVLTFINVNVLCVCEQ